MTLLVKSYNSHNVSIFFGLVICLTLFPFSSIQLDFPGCPTPLGGGQPVPPSAQTYYFACWTHWSCWFLPNLAGFWEISIAILYYWWQQLMTRLMTLLMTGFLLKIVSELDGNWWNKSEMTIGAWQIDLEVAENRLKWLKNNFFAMTKMTHNAVKSCQNHVKYQ